MILLGYPFVIVQQTSSWSSARSSNGGEESYVHLLVDNVVESSSVEYEIGRLVSQALDMVGELVTLNENRVHTTTQPTSRSFNILRVQATLQQALVQVNLDAERTPSAAPHLTPRQFQELGSVFSRNPSALQPVVLQMWYSSERRPDFSTIVSPPSLLVS